MALAIDGSTPAIVTNAVNTVQNLTTASFTPPAGAVLLVLWTGDALTEPTGTPTITDSLGAHLTYAQTDWKHRADASPTVFGQASAWTAVVGSSAAMTVTVTSNAVSGDRTAALAVIVLTGADTVTPVGAHGKSGSTSAASIAQSYTAQATSGWGFIAVNDFDQTGAETAGTGCTVIGSANVSSSITYTFARRTTADDSNGVSNALNLTLPGTSTNLAWVYVEIKPASAVSSPTPGPLVVGPSNAPVPTPRTYLSASFPLGNPAVGTPGPLVVSPRPTTAPVAAAQLFGPGAPAAVVVSASTPGPLVVVGPEAAWPVIPQPLISASQPLGNPAVSTPGPLVVSTPWTSKVPGAFISSNPAAPVFATTATPQPLVVSPPFAPVPIPGAAISASQPLGNPATGTPQPLLAVPLPLPPVLPRAFITAGSATTSTGALLLATPTFTLAPVPGARVFGAPATPVVVSTIGTPGPLVVAPPWRPVLIPKTFLSNNFPLGTPAVPTPQPMVVTPTFRWPTWTTALVGAGVTVHSCTTARPSTGTTGQPSSGITIRPDTGITEAPC